MQIDANLVGYCAATLTTAAFVPQAIKTLRSRNTRAISFWMYAVLTIGVILLVGVSADARIVARDTCQRRDVPSMLVIGWAMHSHCTGRDLIAKLSDNERPLWITPVDVQIQTNHCPDFWEEEGYAVSIFVGVMCRRKVNTRDRGHLNVPKLGRNMLAKLPKTFRWG